MYENTNGTSLVAVTLFRREFTSSKIDLQVFTRIDSFRHGIGSIGSVTGQARSVADSVGMPASLLVWSGRLGSARLGSAQLRNERDPRQLVAGSSGTHFAVLTSSLRDSSLDGIHHPIQEQSSVRTVAVISYYVL